ncbi:DUF4236 domain-containing protein [Pseudomonas sp. 21LCFQ02]|uniref:DUF4236 domain-containing protein n=1 Tax=Pseudomonas sp. 21LCFQ02 TaxID=2957505 RepID=UPI00209B7A1A|nr:DUF4236 domain-containing protein [Pseudomonas sp. 21LCFQ02]MCO8166814.1 DUF4236 domain-containing protein [Pseudomonas sp. 21LCFQ02]
MAIRFRKSVKIAPGLRLNISTKGVSASIGRRGAMINVSKRGTRVTVGLPGTGLSASHLFKAGSAGSSQAAPEATLKDALLGLVIILFVVAFVFLAAKAPWLLVALVGIPALCLAIRLAMKAADRRRQQADPAKYWAERSREIQEAHNRLPDAVVVDRAPPPVPVVEDQDAILLFEAEKLISLTGPKTPMQLSRALKISLPKAEAILQKACKP